MQDIALFLRQGHSDDSLHRAWEEDGVCGGGDMMYNGFMAKRGWMHISHY